MKDTDISVLISSSPILSHPSTQMIEETIGSIRYHLPNAPIYIMCDGVREEQQHLEAQYRQYIKELVKQMLFNWEHIFVCPFPEFTHQAVMTIKTFELVKTPLILFVEHDTPLVEKPIDWEMLMTVANAGISKHIRLHYDESIHPEHQHMMCGKLTDNLIKCVQWHQRPHIANASWYKNLLEDRFSPSSRTWIEDLIYSPVSTAPWEEYTLTIYDPEGTGQNMKRSRDLNGRAGDYKFPPVF
jgi:hypothetical protein